MSLRVFYGGTFDPIHNGHLAIARTARDLLDATVYLVPAADPPHKDETHADAVRRARMLDIALAGEPGVKVDLRELRRAGPSYTIDTLIQLRAQLGASAPIAWMIGSDSLVQLNTWRRWRELFEYAHIIAVARPGSRTDAQWLEQQAADVAAEVNPCRRALDTLHEQPAGGLAVLQLEQLREESSTELRRRIASGDAWRDWVPPAVAGYIDRHNLYAGRDAASTSL